MDILSWTKLNPNITVEAVKKSYFNRYCYKLDLEIHGSSFLRYPDSSIESQMEHRKMVNRSINFAGSWRSFRTKNPDVNEIKSLEFLLSRYIREPGVLKFRIEEPTLSVYADDEMDLYTLALNLYKHTRNSRQIKKIFRPKSDDHLDLLQQGYTVKQNKFGYPYKIMLREGRYSTETKTQLHNYLKNLGDLVHLPRHLVEALEKPYDSFWGSYFYSKDTSILTMLSLIHPNFIRSVETYQTVNK